MCVIVEFLRVCYLRFVCVSVCQCASLTYDYMCVLVESICVRWLRLHVHVCVSWDYMCVLVRESKF